jgi:hypothetical protein
MAAAASLLGPMIAAAEGGTSVATVQRQDSKTHMVAMPADAPLPVWYSFPRGAGLGCGLMLTKSATTITPLVEPGEDGAWPTCNGIPEATAFDWHGKPVYVYCYVQRDTREDTYTYDAFVQVLQGGIEFIEGLNGTDSPSRKPISQAAAWGKSMLAAAEAQQDGFTPSPKDTVFGDAAFLAIGLNRATARCRVTVDRLAAGSGPVAQTVACKGVLATTSVLANDASWFVVLTQGPNGQPQGQVFVADSSGVREASDLEHRLAPQIATGKALEVKAALKAQVAK